MRILESIRLFHRKLSLKTGSIVILALAVAVSLAVILPPVFGQGAKQGRALAEEIALNSPEVLAILGDTGLEGVKPGEFRSSSPGNMYIVLLRESNLYMVAVIDKETEKIIEVFVLEINDELRRELIDIASSDPEVQELLAGGAVFHSFEPSFSLSQRHFSTPDVTIVEESLFSFRARVRVELGDDWWYVRVDLSKREVTDVMAGHLPVYHLYRLIFSIVFYIIITIGLIVLIGVFLKKRLATAFAGTASIGLFIAASSVFILFVPFHWAFLLIFSGLGLIIGIAGIWRSTSRKGKASAIVGTVLCSLFFILFLINIIMWLRHVYLYMF